MAAGKLLPSQEHIRQSCRVFLKALTNRAIEDLIDEATGFDDIRKRDAIWRIIEKHVLKDALPWVRMFDVEFYKQIYRLNDWPFDPERTARPGVIGHWTNDIYDRLAPGVLGALHERVPRNAKDRLTKKLTQFLTKEEGKDGGVFLSSRQRDCALRLVKDCQRSFRVEILGFMCLAERNVLKMFVCIFSKI
jgi:hypothetical protein